MAANGSPEIPATVAVDEYIDDGTIDHHCKCAAISKIGVVHKAKWTIPRILRCDFAGLQYIPPQVNYFFCRETELARVSRMSTEEKSKWLLSEEGKLKKATEAATHGTWKLVLPEHQCRFQPKGTGKILRTRTGNLIACWAVSPEDPSCVIILSNQSSEIISDYYIGFSLLEVMANKRDALVIVYDYSSYGISTGSPSSEGLVADLAAVVAYAKKLAGPITMENFFLLGSSIGTYPSVRLAASETFGGIILLAPPYSVKKVFGDNCRLLGVLVPESDANTSKYIGKVKCRIIILHGDKDKKVPISNGLMLHSIAPTSRFYRIPGAGHADLIYRKEVWKHLRTFVDGDEL